MILITPSPANFAGSTAVVGKRPAVARLALENVPKKGLTRRCPECLIPSSLETCHTITGLYQTRGPQWRRNTCVWRGRWQGGWCGASAQEALVGAAHV